MINCITDEKIRKELELTLNWNIIGSYTIYDNSYVITISLCINKIKIIDIDYTITLSNLSFMCEFDINTSCFISDIFKGYSAFLAQNCMRFNYFNNVLQITSDDRDKSVMIDITITSFNRILICGQLTKLFNEIKQFIK